MSYEMWRDKTNGFRKVDVRHLQGNFAAGLVQAAARLEVGEGLEVVQTFEPHPLYAALENLGFEHHTEQTAETEFRVFFCRTEKKEGEEAPFRPLALLNYPMIDEKLGKIAVDFWETTWQSPRRTLPYETRLLLSVANAVGAGRMRQASREAVFPSTPASSRSPSKKRWRPSVRRAIRSPSGVRRTSRATTSASPAADRPASALVTLALE